MARKKRDHHIKEAVRDTTASVPHTRPFLHVAIIVVTVIIVYSNTIRAPFVFDDMPMIVNNPTIWSFDYFLSPSKVKSLAIDVEDVIANFKTRYVTYFTFAVNYAIGGGAVAGYHMVNIFIHAVNAALVYFLLRFTLAMPYFGTSHWPLPLLTALIFAAHPIETQGVTYLTQRAASLAAMFYLLSITLYAKSRITHDGRWYYVGAVVSAFVAMFTKENAVTLPVVIAIWEFLFNDGDVKKRATRLIPFAIAAMVIPLTLIIDNRQVTAGIGVSGFSRWEYLFTQFQVIVKYIRLMILPVGQNIDHDVAVAHSFFDPATLGSFVLLAGILAGGAYCLRISRTDDTTAPLSLRAKRSNLILCGREIAAVAFGSLAMTPGSRSITEGLPDAKFLRLTAFGVFWFFVTLSIESSVFPIGVELIFEHRVYLPSIGFFMAITALALTLVEKKPALAKPAVAVCIALIVALAAAAYARNSVWRTEVDLWQDAAFKSPGKARTRLSYGMALTDMGMYDEAIREFRAALSIDPKLAKAHNNLGLTYFKMGGVDEAVREYKLALDIMPDYAFARNNLAVAYNKLGLADMAVAEFKKGLSVNYYDVLAHDTLGVTYAMQGRLDEAIDEFRTALSINPGFAKAREHLEKALAQKSGETSR